MVIDTSIIKKVVELIDIETEKIPNFISFVKICDNYENNLEVDKDVELQQ